MIRAKVKNSQKFIYIYQIYYQEKYKEDFCWHFLVSLPMTLGLRVMYLDEVYDIKNIDRQGSKNIIDLYEYQHPVLKKILDEDWELYNDIIEGVDKAWLVFEEKLGHRP